MASWGGRRRGMSSRYPGGVRSILQVKRGRVGDDDHAQIYCQTSNVQSEERKGRKERRDERDKRKRRKESGTCLSSRLFVFADATSESETRMNGWTHMKLLPRHRGKSRIIKGERE